ncbi:hypothetical protein NMG60_11027225, partial [Bertholletia excelsa]
LAVLALPPALATEQIVGDEKGWSLNFDYQTWAAGKEFRVGDTLVFKYPQGAHNVLRVDGDGFQQCATAATTQPLTTGNDVITLASEGRKWYICGKGNHCKSGMKLAITVLPQVGSPATAPSSERPSSNSATRKFALSKFSTWMVGASAIITMLVV